MPIEPKRIEAAARATHAHFQRDWGAGGWADMPKASRAAWLKDAAEILAAAYPELASDPPTAWVAPWKRTEEMIDASWAASADDDDWAVMRDAYTKERTP